MKVAVVDRKFESNMGEMKSTNFQMKSTPHAFKILSASLYKDIELAVVRELIANAWDSHAANGNLDTPFHVHSPTTLEPFFEVRDTGVGMSPDFVHSTYITFFDSDKSHSDEAIGGFGLGSKAPFAYSDQFVMTSRYNGIEYKYQLLINGESEYQIMDRGNRPTDEPNGVSVRVPVADKDKDKFSAAISKVLTYFPKGVSSNITVTPPEYSAEIELSDGVVAKFLQNGYGYHHNVVMGFIRYDVGVHGLGFLNESVSDSNYRYSHHGAHHFNSCDIYAPIGYFDITPDREGIRFSDLTKNNYIKLNAEIKSEVEKQSAAEYAKCCTPLKKLKYILSLADNRLFKDTISSDERKLVYQEFAWPDGISVTQLKVASSSRYRSKSQIRASSSHQPPFNSSMGYPKILQRALDPAVPVLYQMDKRRPYMKHFTDLYDAGTFVDPTYVITGETQAIDKWAKDLSLPPIPTVPKIARAKGTKGVRKYAATKYPVEAYTWSPEGERSVDFNSLSAREALDLADVLFLHTPYELSALLRNTPPEVIPKDKIVVFITLNYSHSRVARNLVKDGAISLKGLDSTEQFRLFYESPAVNLDELHTWLGARSVVLKSSFNGSPDGSETKWKTLKALGYQEIIDYTEKKRALMQHNTCTDDIDLYTKRIIETVINKEAPAFKTGVAQQETTVRELFTAQTHLKNKYGEWATNATAIEEGFSRLSEDYWAARTEGFASFITHLLEDRSL